MQIRGRRRASQGVSKSGEVGEPGMEWVRGRWRISQVGVESGRGGDLAWVGVSLGEVSEPVRE